MPEWFWMSWMYRTGRPVTELKAMMDNEPEPIQSRFWIYINAGGR